MQRKKDNRYIRNNLKEQLKQARAVPGWNENNALVNERELWKSRYNYSSLRESELHKEISSLENMITASSAAVIYLMKRLIEKTDDKVFMDLGLAMEEYKQLKVAVDRKEFSEGKFHAWLEPRNAVVENASKVCDSRDSTRA